MLEVPDYFLNTIRAVQAATRGTVSVSGEVFSPFTHFMELLGYENALMALLDDATKVHALLERLTASSCAWAVAQSRAGVDAVLISSAFAGGGFLSRDMYAEFVLPYERRLAEAVRTAGKPVYTHTCGNIGDRLDLMVATTIDGLDTLDPPPLGNTLLEDAKRDVGQQVFLKGNMNSVELLAAKTEAQVAAEANRCLDAASQAGVTFSAPPAPWPRGLNRGNWSCSCRWPNARDAVPERPRRPVGAPSTFPPATIRLAP